MVSLKDSNRFNFTILTHDPDAFKDVSLNSNTKIMSVKPGEVPFYYGDAALGFVIRDSSIVNLVACPTKLIEYFENEVVPVVDNPSIGDFKAMGYQYVDYRNLNDDISEHSLLEIVKNNKIVLRKLLKKSEKGKNELLRIIKSISESSQGSGDGIGTLLAIAVNLSGKVTTLKVGIEGANQLAINNASEAEVYRNELDSIKKSKKLLLVSKIAKLTGR
jgi:hypothetical protein